MEELADITRSAEAAHSVKLPISVIIPVRNEARNLPRCLDALNNVGEVYVIDSQSTDETVEIARSHGAKVVQFHYQGGWPKKRQWAMNTLPLVYDYSVTRRGRNPYSAVGRRNSRRDSESKSGRLFDPAAH